MGVRRTKSVAVPRAAGPRVVRAVGDLAVIRTADHRERPVRRSSIFEAPVADLIAATVTSVVAMIAGPDASLTRRVLGSVLVVGVWLIGSAAVGALRVNRMGALEEARRAVGVVLGSAILAHTVFSGGRTALGATVIAATFLAFLTRGVSRLGRNRRYAAGLARDRVIVLGTSEHAGRLAHDMLDNDASYEPLGFVVVDGPPVSPNGLGLLGPMANLVDIIREHEVDRIVVPHGEISAEVAAHLLDVARRAHVEVVVAMNVPTMRSSSTRTEPLGKHMALAVRPASLSRWQVVLKRALDLALGAALVVILSPLMLAIALAVRVSSRGPVLFRQERVTRAGEVFRMLKFRTMVEGAEELLDGDERSQPFFKREGDHRVTRVGRALRRLSMDELPQLFNVLAGTMSLVGPRPLPVAQVRANEELLRPRQEVRAGVTGWWQVNGRNDRDLAESVQLDMYYIRNWSLLLDLYILARTARAIVDRRAR